MNGWRRPWVPVVLDDGTVESVSLRDLFLRAHLIQSLCPGLSALDRDALYRFLIAVAAVIARSIDEDDDALGESFPAAAIDDFGDRFADHFELAGPRPFLQRWDRTQSDLDGLVAAAAGKPVRGLNPIDQLLPSVPGASSSQWAVRVDTRDPADPATAMLLLVTAWFQTKNGNGQDPFGGKHLKGSAGTWHTNPLAVYYIDPTNLARTIYANMPWEWHQRRDLPLFLDRELPSDFASAPRASLTRFTYAKTLPLLYIKDDQILGFILGADQTIAVPPLGKDDKESLGRIHENDHTRLYVETAAKKGAAPSSRPRGSFDARLSSTEGFVEWFRADRGIGGAIERWRAIDRFRNTNEADARHVEIGLFSERTDGKGSRTAIAWDSMPAEFAAAGGALRGTIEGLLELAGKCRWAFVPAGRIATGESKAPAVVVTGQAAFYTAIRPVLERLKNEVATRAAVGDPLPYASEIAQKARETFEATTEPLITPRQVAAVAAGRGQFNRMVAKAMADGDYTAPNPKESK